MNLRRLLAILVHELRFTRRLVRYWLFVGLGGIAFGALFAYYAFLHGMFSRHSGSIAWLTPRYLIAAFGFWAVTMLTTGAVFLAFDVRARDTRSRIAEALDVRPFRNIELVFGRALAILVAALVPSAVIVLLTDGIGWFFGETLEPRSMLSLLLFALLPTLFVAIAATMLVTIVVRSRIVSAVVVLGGLVGSVVVLFRLPMPWGLWFDPTGYSLATFPSDLAPVLATGFQLVQRAAVVLLGIGMLVLTAAVHPRRDGSRRPVAAGTGAVFVLAAVAVVAAGMNAQRGNLEQTDAWRAAHRSLDGEPVADLERLGGRLAIDPGRGIDAELELELAAPAGTDLARVVLTLNPGFAVREARLDGREVPFEAHDGLLVVEHPLPAGSRATLALVYGGSPDVRFAYLDQAVGPRDGTAQDQQSRAILGPDDVVFTRRFAALLPGAAWLPQPGPYASGDDPARRPRDPFALDLAVDVPDGFLVAGPGRAREETAPGAGRRFRFAPGAPVTAVALVASRYVARTAEIDGVEFTVLVSPGHARGIDRFAPGREAIVEWVAERLGRARDLGLAYPYDGFTIAEVPARLRGYGGGWRMDTVLAQPGLALMRESSLPTAAFDRWLAGSALAELDEAERGRAIRDALLRFFRGDLLGGDVVAAAARNPAWHQVAASGRDGLVLDYLVETLSAEVLIGDPGFFSSHLFDRNLQRRIQQTIVQVVTGGGEVTPAEALASQVLNRPAVWERIGTLSLAEFDPTEDPDTTLAALQLKGRALARTLVLADGEDATGRALGALVAARRGQRFVRDDVSAAAGTLGLDWARPLADWIDGTALPAFVAGTARARRLAASEAGTRPRVQVVVPVRNEGETTGFVVVHVVLTPEEEAGQAGPPGRRNESRRSEPVRIEPGEAREIGLVVRDVPIRVEIEPLLAENRRPFAVRIERPGDDEEPLAAEPFEGSRPSDWAPRDAGLVLDDLDETFEVEEPEETGWLARLRGSGRRLPDSELDRGLPVLGLVDQPSATRWGRIEAPSAWGRWRHTAALAMPADDRTAAVFRGELAESGAYRLEIHLPPIAEMPFPARGDSVRPGRWRLAFVAPEGGPELTFDAGGADPGWHDVGRVRLAAGPVAIRLSSAAAKRALLIADAVRLVPAAPEDGSPASDGGAR